MSNVTEYHYTAQPAMPICQGTNCYCFYGTNPLNQEIHDEDCLSVEEDGWSVVEDDEWGVRLGSLTFRHPRVLLAYFRFVDLHNEVASNSEKIRLPYLSKDMANYIKSHCSIQDPPEEFLGEIQDLVRFIHELC